jgi:hypothetical protein
MKTQELKLKFNKSLGSGFPTVAIKKKMLCSKLKEAKSSAAHDVILAAHCFNA